MIMRATSAWPAKLIWNNLRTRSANSPVEPVFDCRAKAVIITNNPEMVG